MKKTAEKNKDMKNLMETPIFYLEEFRFKSINDSTNRVGNPTEDKVSHPARTKGRCQFTGEKDNEPAHHQVDGCGQPSRR